MESDRIKNTRNKTCPLKDGLFCSENKKVITHQANTKCLWS